MKQVKALVLGFLMAATAADGECVTVYMRGVNRIPFTTMAFAKLKAGLLFDDIGVSVNWTQASSRRTAEACVAIEMEFSTDAAPTFHPGAMALARPHRSSGTQILIFANRVVQGYGSDPEILGYVMAHEIGHVLEGIERHSAQGVMKARFTPTDYRKMKTRALRFAAEDAELIHAHFRNREVAMLSAAVIK